MVIKQAWWQIVPLILLAALTIFVAGVWVGHYITVDLPPNTHKIVVYIEW